ncbi:MAG: hypothetical protein M1470_02620 [Bacteroidetes bacterium]|nr:hypothetical protein [Bacteroidota bacterium]MCL5738925.1 hypothetical protein [Bacteroidota bacterium]
MTTKAAAQVNKFPEDSSEKIAYKIAEQVKTRESNDNNRLGYHIWRYLTGTIPTIDEAIRVSGVRLAEGETLENITEQVAKQLKERGFEVKRER